LIPHRLAEADLDLDDAGCDFLATGLGTVFTTTGGMESMSCAPAVSKGNTRLRLRKVNRAVFFMAELSLIFAVVAARDQGSLWIARRLARLKDEQVGNCGIAALILEVVVGRRV
jgi:hypothetical protein